MKRSSEFAVQTVDGLLMCSFVVEEEQIGDVVAEESVLVSHRDVDKTPVMELLQRLSDSEPPQSEQLEPLHLRM